MVISASTFDGIRTDGSGPGILTTHTADRGDWVLTNQTVDAQGRPTALPTWFGDCLPPPPGAEQTSGKVEATPSRGTLNRCFARLTREGYRQHVVYQPSSHFWPLQWAETGLYLVLTAVLTGLSFWWTRRRLG